MERLSGVTKGNAGETEIEKHNSAGVLCKREIEDYSLIEGLDEKCLQASSYDLRLGDKHCLFDENGKMSYVFLGDGNGLSKANEGEKEFIFQFSSEGPNILCIPPFGSAVIELKETVNTYDAAKNHHCLIVGRFDLKIKAIYKGLISQQATQVEPCYKGKLYCFIHNLTAKEIRLQREEAIATIEFSYAGASTDKEEINNIIKETFKKNKTKYDGKYGCQWEETGIGTGIGDIRWLCYHGRLPYECGLASIHRTVNNNIHSEIKKYMERNETVEQYSEQIRKKLSERDGAIKLIISLVVSIVSVIGAGFGLSVLTQLRYFQEQLSFLTDSNSGNLDSEAIEAIRNHTQNFQMLEEKIFWVVVVVIPIIASFLLVYYKFISVNYWKRKSNRLNNKIEYKNLKREDKERRKEKKKEEKEKKKEEKEKKKEEKQQGKK